MIAGNLTIEEQQEIDDSVAIIELVTGQIKEKPFWTYISMYPSKYLDYQEKIQSGQSVKLEDYGIVIDKGWGSEPPQDVQERMKKHFGADNDLQDKLIAMTQEMLDAEGDQNQENQENQETLLN